MKPIIPAIIATAIICSSCLAEDGNDYWDPPTNDIAIAEKVARTFCWNYMSDQLRTNDSEVVLSVAEDTITASNTRPPPPDDFTIHQIPFSRYVRQHGGTNKDGKRIVIIAYYDPVVFPDWERIAIASGGFPAYFTVSVDMDNMQVCNHYAATE